MALFTITTRSLQFENGISQLTLDLLSALAGLLIASLLLASILILLKRHRKSSKRIAPLPIYERKLAPPMRPYHRRTQSTYSIPDASRFSKSSTIVSYEEDLKSARTTTSRLPSPLPEIRVTLPDEIDAAGQYHSGRVLLVRIGENSEGLEPIDGYTRNCERTLEPFPRLSG